MTTMTPRLLTYDEASHDEFLRVQTYLKHHHPFPPPFDHLKNSLVVLVEDGPYLACVIYLHWVTGADHVLELHAAGAPQYRGRWLTRWVIGFVAAAAQSVKAKSIFAQIPSARIASIYRRLGFKTAGPFAYISLETNNG